ncbi:glycosyltransferase [Amycolatopsis sp. H20-H5]|uniref:glycosyltransferase n=1 Tax=Amycolatopsis sp. H20-H5 TaxID=3046309 RepID=UPI002DB95944|nr:glycosyltransferase [Amycolatopsis sp. H20-H5]MEC3974749.1 glycosyltransferase [Amycolatopsis sp. H20-H5]
MKIFGVLADRSGCGWYRLKLPLAELARRGHQVQLSESLPANLPPDVDVLVGQRVCMPGPSANFQRHAQRGGVLTVLELDDDLWQVDPSNRRAAEFFTPELLANLRRNVEMADVVTTTTDVLAERLAEINRNVRVLPNQVPAWLLGHERPVTNERVTLGWAGSPSHARDWGELNAPVRRLLQHPDYRDRVELHMIGGPDWTDRVRTPRSTVRHTGWFESVADLYRAIDFDIGLAPLRPSVFNDAKSDVKLLEYAALGIPAVLSDTGPYRVDVPAARAVLPSGWTDALRELIDDPECRAQLGKQAREWAATRTIEGNAHRWLEAYS